MSTDSPTPLEFPSRDELRIERVFPIRNLIGDERQPLEPGTEPPIQERENVFHDGSEDQLVIDEEDQSGSQASSTSHNLEDSEPPFLPPPYPAIPPEESLRKLTIHEATTKPSTPRNRDIGGEGDEEGGDGDGDGDAGGRERQRTERAQFVPTADGPPGVLAGIISHGHNPTFSRCEDEPIHTPGAVQQFGALLALRYNATGDLEVRIVSENSFPILGYHPEQLFRLRSFLDVFGEDSREDAVARIRHALEDAVNTDKEDTNLDIFGATIITSDGSSKQLWCAVHISKGTSDLIVCEFEKYSDVFNIEDLSPNKALPETPTQTVNIEVHPEEKTKSTTRESMPLRVLEIARRKQRTGVSSMDIFHAMTQAQQQLGAAGTVQQVLDVVVGIISELSGFHRVMFYRFDSKKNGCVDAELINPQASSDLFRGLHFPASDIPKQARELYKINRIRILYDRDAETARLLCREPADFEVPLDLSHSYLRAMSPIHLKYLGNMGVRSSMSISIVINDDLWGLVACHGYGDVGIRVTLPIRELCRNIGECAAINIERLLMLRRIESRKPPSSAPPPQNPAGFIAASSADLLRVFGADFGLLSIQDEARAIGKLDPYREALAILAHLQRRRYTSVKESQNINADFPGINYPPGINVLAGLIIIPLSMGGKDFMVFFRKGQLREIRWAGNPYEKIARAGSEYLEPRTSFTRWTETVFGMSTEWTVDQLETASVLSLLYGRFIEIWRQKEAAGNNNRMTRLLIRNSSHEVRTPLNAIVNYLELALENSIDDSTRDLLTKAHKASRSLIYVIDDLLNLTKAKEGPLSSIDESFNLGATVSEVITQFRKEAMRKNLDLTVSTHQGLPEMVKGDASRLRQVLSNVTSNAFQHSVEGGIKVDISTVSTQGSSSVIAITVQDAGIGMSENQLDSLFQEFEQVIDEDSMAQDDPSAINSLSKSASSLGVGLAVVARYVRNMRGQIRVRSELGRGTIFGIEIPFEHAPTTPYDPLMRSSSFLSQGPYARLPLSDVMASSPGSGTIRPESEMLEFMSDSGISQTPDSPLEIAPSGKHSRTESTGEPMDTTYPFPNTKIGGLLTNRETLTILIAEDNPINSRLLTRRLQKLGHEVEQANDGQECHDYFTRNPDKVDAILMDLQMPLVDGVMSTEMIRKFEKDMKTKNERRRVPIIAVSASLSEAHRFDYIQSGFDAWILKPIDFKRLDYLLCGIKSRDMRKDATYTPGCWEKGGWFMP